jgi:hypothetical protein
MNWIRILNTQLPRTPLRSLLGQTLHVSQSVDSQGKDMQHARLPLQRLPDQIALPPKSSKTAFLRRTINAIRTSFVALERTVATSA